MTKQTFKQMVWLLCLAVALTACKEKTEIVEVVRSIKTITVKEQAREKIFKFSGVVAAVDSSGLSVQVGGQVISVEVDIGDRVAKDQVLAVLDPEPYQLDVDAIKAELIKAKDNVAKSKAEYERQKRIFKQGAGAQRFVEVSEYEYKAARSAVDYQIARLDQVNRNLRKTKLLAPYDGTIAWRSVQPNEEVGIGQHEVTVIGFLDPMPTITGYAVTPVVGLVSDEARVVVDRTEVDYTFELPLDFLLDEGNDRLVDREWEGRRFRLIEFHYNGERVWGATAYMLLAF